MTNRPTPAKISDREYEYLFTPDYVGYKVSDNLELSKGWHTLSPEAKHALTVAVVAVIVFFIVDVISKSSKPKPRNQSSLASKAIKRGLTTAAEILTTKRK